MMELNLMLQTATTLLAITALGGLAMAAIRFAGKPRPPSWLAMLHGFLASAGLTLLVYAAFTVGLPGRATAALALFLVASVGGIVLNLSYHLKAAPLPKWLVLVHAGIAIVAFLLLLWATWSASRG